MNQPEVKQDTKPPRRKTRKPFGVTRDKSQVSNKRADFHYVWLNDVGNTIGEAIEGGYEHVLKTDPERVVSGDVTGNTAGGSVDSRVSQIVSRDGTVAFLMRIPMDFYVEDQRERDKDSRKPLEDLDKARGRPSELDENFYVKKSKAVTTNARKRESDED